MEINPKIHWAPGVAFADIDIQFTGDDPIMQRAHLQADFDIVIIENANNPNGSAYVVGTEFNVTRFLIHHYDGEDNARDVHPDFWDEDMPFERDSDEEEEDEDE